MNNYIILNLSAIHVLPVLTFLAKQAYCILCLFENNKSNRQPKINSAAVQTVCTSPQEHKGNKNELLNCQDD